MATILVSAQVASAQEIRVTTLGTGTPGLSIERTGPATLVEAGGLTLLFDAGRAASVRLSQAGVGIGDLDGVFITHYHSDHIGGLSDIWLTGYMAPTFRQTPLPLYGPAGLGQLTRGLEEAYGVDREQRLREYALLGLPMAEAAAAFRSHQFENEGVVFDQDGVTVTAFTVVHGEGPAFGYRIDYAGRSVLISGDTSFSDNLVSHAVGVDVIVHEAMLISEESLRTPVWQGIMSLHTPPTDLAVVFTRAAPRLAVLHHIGLIGGVALNDLVRQTQAGYAGELLVAEDLMSIVIGDEISVSRR